MKMEEVILVDIEDREIGTMEKLLAHQKGSLHRAFSIFLFNSRNELLLQKRADTKYHSKGLWSNTCCSHPKPGENILDAGRRRLREEMGLFADLFKAFDFIYRVPLENGLIEYEFDHVLKGFFEGDVHLNPEEASSYEWVSQKIISKRIQQHPERYTYWLKEILLKGFDLWFSL